MAAQSKFRRDQDQFQTFTAQCETFVAGRVMVFPTDHTKVTFVPSLPKEAAAKQAILLTEGNNYGNFVYKFKGHFGDPIQRIDVS